jgi:hypothetical protein
MRILDFLFLNSIFALFCYSCTNHMQQNSSETNFIKLSLEIENTHQQDLSAISFYLPVQTCKDSKKASAEKPITISINKSEKRSKKNITSTQKKERQNSPGRDKTLKESPEGSHSSTSRYENIIWKIGEVFLYSGLVIIVLAYIWLRLSLGLPSIWILGLIISLGLIILSLPFLLTGWIIGKIQGE